VDFKPPGRKLPLGADALKLVLPLPAGTSPAAAYRAELQTSKGLTEVVEIEGQDERSVTVVIPEARLRPGRYAVQLQAVAADKTERTVGDYLFDIE
jgi:hypothetical protein